MSAIWTELNPFVTAALLGLAMLLAWAIAWWRGHRVHRNGRDASSGKFTDATFALLGLLLAFTFSMSLVKHEQRRQMAVTDSNAIGDFSTCVGLLEDPPRSHLQRVVRGYVEHRLSLAEAALDEATLQQELQSIQRMHGELQSLVKAAVDNGTPVVVPLVSTLNELTSSHAARMAAVRDRLPPTIELLLFLAAVLATALLGRQQGSADEIRPGGTMGFIVLVCMVVWVTLDLNQPQKGWITVSQESLQQLLLSLPTDETTPAMPADSSSLAQPR
jgi:hypothetical protein